MKFRRKAQQPVVGQQLAVGSATMTAGTITTAPVSQGEIWPRWDLADKQLARIVFFSSQGEIFHIMVPPWQVDGILQCLPGWQPRAYGGSPIAPESTQDRIQRTVYQSLASRSWSSPVLHLRPSQHEVMAHAANRVRKELCSCIHMQ